MYIVQIAEGKTRISTCELGIDREYTKLAKHENRLSLVLSSF